MSADLIPIVEDQRHGEPWPIVTQHLKKRTLFFFFDIFTHLYLLGVSLCVIAMNVPHRESVCDH